MKKIFFIVINLSSVLILSAQNVGIGTTTPNNSAALDIQSNNKGMLVPRIALTASNVASPVAAPADALLIYNTATAGTGSNAVTPGFYYWSAASSRWTSINQTSTNGNVGYGSWGDCSMTGITEYNPVADDNGITGSQFGFNVSVSSNFAIIGNPRDDIGANTDQGSASIYQFNGSNWVFMQKISDPTGAALNNFGINVSISGNYAVVGEPRYDVGPNTGQGAACVYQFNGSSWVLMQRIIDATGSANASFGQNVSVSGNYIAIGAVLETVGGHTLQGTASVYQYNGTSWVLMQKIIDATGGSTDNFGRVALSGNYLAIGGSNSNLGQGSVSVYQYNGSAWVLMQKIIPAGSFGDYFGATVSLSGTYLLVSSNGDDIGSNTDQGSASIFQYNGTNWVLMQTLIDPNGTTNDFFGLGVSISSNYAIIGITGHAVGNSTNQGSAIIYQHVGAGWQKLQYITDPGGSTNDGLGQTAALDGATKRFLIGAPGYSGQKGKVVFGKIN